MNSIKSKTSQTLSASPFLELISIMAKLRAPDGCPWDRDQNHSSILNCLIEETYEFVDAVERKDWVNMREELGDLMLQVVFHAQMAAEENRFNVNDVIGVLNEKLVRRHPHVFGEGKLEKADEVQVQWDALKKAEKGDAAHQFGALGEIPKHLPALLKALKLQKRAAKVGFDWPNWKGPMDKIIEESNECVAVAESSLERRTEEVGDLLFAAVNLARHFDVDPERALAKSNEKFTRRFQAVEATTKKQGKELSDLNLQEMDVIWDSIKQLEKNGKIQ